MTQYQRDSTPIYFYVCGNGPQEDTVVSKARRLLNHVDLNKGAICFIYVFDLFQNVNHVRKNT
jgi:hypothetical protein